MSVKILSLGAILMVFTLNAQKKYSKSFVKKQKQEIKEWVESENKNSQVMVYKIITFAELDSSQPLLYTILIFGSLEKLREIICLKYISLTTNFFLLSIILLYLIYKKNNNNQYLY